MSEEPTRPEHDPDHALARRMGAQLDQGRPLDLSGQPAGGEDPLVEALAAYQARMAAAKEKPDAAQSARMWTAIAGDLAPATRPAVAPWRERDRLPQRRRTLFRRPAAAWAGAMAVLVVMLGVVWYQMGSRPGAVLVASAAAERVVYTAGDASVVTLRPHSQLYALPGADGEDRYRLEGEAFFDVTHDAARTFVVETGLGEVAVLGTRFNVSTWAQETVVFLEAGRVSLSVPGGGQAQMLAPGQQSRITADGMLAPPAATDGREDLDWLANELHYEQRPLRRVVAELEAHFGVAVQVPAAMAEETVSGRLLLGGVAQSLADLGGILGGRFERVADRSYRFVTN